MPWIRRSLQSIHTTVLDVHRRGFAVVCSESDRHDAPPRGVLSSSPRPACNSSISPLRRLAHSRPSCLELASPEWNLIALSTTALRSLHRPSAAPWIPTRPDAVADSTIDSNRRRRRRACSRRFTCRSGNRRGSRGHSGRLLVIIAACWNSASKSSSRICSARCWEPDPRRLTRSIFTRQHGKRQCRCDDALRTHGKLCSDFWCWSLTSPRG